MFKTMILVSAIACSMILATGCASTDMHDDGMMHDKEMSATKMEKMGDMEHDAMKKDTMKKDTMKKDGM